MNKCSPIRATIFVTVFLISLTNYAQNFTVAKKFYEKAQVAYVNQEYEKATTLLDRTESYLGDAINADVAYLKGKILIKSAININEAKHIFEEFVSDLTKTNDTRINEIQALLKGIENNSEIDSFGNFKDTTGRFGYHYEYFNSNSLKKKVLYNTQGDAEEIEEYFENGTPKISQPKDGNYKVYYPSGNLLTEGTVIASNKQGTSFIKYDDDTKVDIEKTTNVFFSKKNLMFEEDIEKWTPFLNVSKELNTKLFVGFSDFNLEEYDIIIWNACQSYGYNKLLFNQLEYLLKKGKYIIITGSPQCLARSVATESYRPLYSNEAANTAIKKYGIKITDYTKSPNDIMVSENEIFNTPFSFSTNSYATVEILSKKTQKEAKNSQPIIIDQNQDALMVVYDKRNISGKLFVHSLGSTFYKGVNKDGTQDTSIINIYKAIIENYLKE